MNRRQLFARLLTRPVRYAVDPRSPNSPHRRPMSGQYGMWEQAAAQPAPQPPVARPPTARQAQAKSGIAEHLRGTRLAMHLLQLKHEFAGDPEMRARLDAALEDRGLSQSGLRALGDTSAEGNWGQIGKLLKVRGHAWGNAYNWNRIGESLAVDKLVREYVKNRVKVADPTRLYQTTLKHFDPATGVAAYKSGKQEAGRMADFWGGLREHVRGKLKGVYHAAHYSDDALARSLRRQAYKEQDAAEYAGEVPKVDPRAVPPMVTRKPNVVKPRNDSNSDYLSYLPGFGSAERYMRNPLADLVTRLSRRGRTVRYSHAAFHAGFRASDGEDRLPSLVYADWLEEQGQHAHAEIVRLHVRRAEENQGRYKAVHQMSGSDLTPEERQAGVVVKEWPIQNDHHVISVGHYDPNAGSHSYHAAIVDAEDAHRLASQLHAEGVHGADEARRNIEIDHPHLLRPQPPHQLARRGRPVRYSSHEAFHAAMRANTTDRLPPQVYADWLEEEGMPTYAKIVRHQQRKAEKEGTAATYSQDVGEGYGEESGKPTIREWPGADGRHFVGVSFVQHGSPVRTMHSVSLDPASAHDVVSRLGEEGLAGADEASVHIQRRYPHVFGQRPEHRMSRQHYAAYRAPAGGMLAKGIYYPGGQTVPDVTKLAAGEPRPPKVTNYQPGMNPPSAGRPKPTGFAAVIARIGKQNARRNRPVAAPLAPKPPAPPPTPLPLVGRHEPGPNVKVQDYRPPAKDNGVPLPRSTRPKKNFLDRLLGVVAKTAPTFGVQPRGGISSRWQRGTQPQGDKPQRPPSAPKPYSPSIPKAQDLPPIELVEHMRRMIRMKRQGRVQRYSSYSVFNKVIAGADVRDRLPSLVYADWLEEQGHVAHAKAVRRAVSQAEKYDLPPAHIKTLGPGNDLRSNPGIHAVAHHNANDGEIPPWWSVGVRYVPPEADEQVKSVMHTAFLKPHEAHSLLSEMESEGIPLAAAHRRRIETIHPELIPGD